MSRAVFDPSKVLPSTLDKMVSSSDRVIKEVADAIKNNQTVVVGMKTNPHCKRALSYLKKEDINYCYLEYGSYTAQWKKRLSLKIWVGWKTFPMVFIDGQFIGGADELKKFLSSDEGESLKQAS